MEINAKDTNDWVKLDFEDEKPINEALAAVVTKPKMIFFEVYVDEGKLARILIQNHQDVEAATFTLPEWDFRTVEAREAFLNLLRRIRPGHVGWQLRKERCSEEKAHLKFADVWHALMLAWV